MTDLWTSFSDDARDLVLARMLHGVNGLNAWRVPRWIYGIVCASKTSGGMFSNPNHKIWKDLCGVLGLAFDERIQHVGGWKVGFRGTVLDTILLSGLARNRGQVAGDRGAVLPEDVLAPMIEGVNLGDVKNVLALSIPHGNHSRWMFGRRLAVLRHLWAVALTRYRMNRTQFDQMFCASIDSDRFFRHVDADPMPMLYFLLGVGATRPPQLTLNFGKGLTLRFVENAISIFGDTHNVPENGFDMQNASDAMLSISTRLPKDAEDAAEKLANAKDAIDSGGAPQCWEDEEFVFPHTLLHTPYYRISEQIVPGHYKALLTLLKVAGIDDRVKAQIPHRMTAILEELPSWRSAFVDTLPTLDTRSA